MRRLRDCKTLQRFLHRKGLLRRAPEKMQNLPKKVHIFSWGKQAEDHGRQKTGIWRYQGNVESNKYAEKRRCSRPHSETESLRTMR